MDNMKMIQHTDAWFVILTVLRVINSLPTVLLASLTTECMYFWREQFVFRIVKLDIMKNLQIIPVNLAMQGVQAVMDRLSLTVIPVEMMVPFPITKTEMKEHVL